MAKWEAVKIFNKLSIELVGGCCDIAFSEMWDLKVSLDKF